MNTQTFLELVMPSGGKKVIAVPVPRREGAGHWFKYRSFDTFRAAASAIKRIDDRGDTVYFGVNGFGDWYHDAKKGKLRIRTQENVVACRSLFDDFDVDPEDDKKYASRKEAFAGVVKLSQALKLTPTVTSSGGGFHVYFTLDEDIDLAQWDELSRLKRDVTHHLGLKADSAVDLDSARILRPVGSHNHKYDPPRPVEVIKRGKPYSYDRVRDTLTQYIRENEVAPAPTTRQTAVADNPFAAALEGDFPPSDANKIADRCAAIREFRDSEGNIPEPHWHRAIGVLKHCVDGEAIIHDWSSGYEDYSQIETQDKIDEWTMPPTSCAEMDRHVGCMANCPFANKCKTPITLGYSDEAPSTADETAAPTAPTPQPSSGAQQPAAPVIEGQTIPYWPTKGYRWNGAHLSRAIVDDDGVTHWRPFARSFVYPINRIRDPEGTWVIHWRAKEKNGAWREFFMPTSELASTDMMAKTFAANEVFLARTKNARNDMAEFAEGLIETLQAWRIETKTYNQFGWTDDFSGFVVGTTKITAKGEEEVLCDPSVPEDVTVDFGQSGTLQDWVHNIDKLFNRTGAEPFQFALCHAMGSALVQLFGSSNWHGLPLAFTGDGGTGKSTACKIACGFYGRPKLMERQTGEQGSTLNAAIKRIALMGAVPVLLDEFSGRAPEELMRTGYALANGRDKERLGANGRFSTVGGEWFKNSFITSNDSILESIAKLPAGYRVEATQLRFFEVPLPADYRVRVFPDISQAFIEHHMDHVCGTPLRPYIQFLIRNQDWVRRQIAAARNKFNPKSSDDNRERFYRDTIVTALVAGKIAERLNLISFDLKAMRLWAQQQVERMREDRRETNVDVDEHVAQYIATLPGRLIITKNMTARQGPQVPLEDLRGAGVGRVCIDDKVAYVTTQSVTEYCSRIGVPPSALRDAMLSSGLMVKAPDGSISRRMYIGAGTTVPSAQARCYELDYNKLFGGASLRLVQAGNTVTTKATEQKE